jgi:hypothetical protein
MAEGGLSIGTLSGRIELDDHFTATITLSNDALDELEKRFGKTDATVRKTAEGFLTAELALKGVEEIAHLAAEGLKMVSTEGAAVADVEENFNKVTLAAGELGEELLGGLREGSHNTITDFSLMKSVNDNLAAGINLTKQNYQDIATGAFALAQAKGIDVAAAFEKINDAMTTGKVKGVQYLVGKIDLADAEDRYAKILGTSADKLNADEKAEAGRMVILEKVTAATQRLGEQQDGLDEKVAQAATSWHNFEEDLGKTVASSPVVINAFEQIEDILTKAFGTDKETAIKNITKVIEDSAEAAVKLVGAGVDVVEFLVKYRAAIEPVVVGVTAYYGASLLAEAGTKAWGLAIEGVATVSSKLGAIGLAATAIYAAFELGKWQPVSDFFEKLGLRLQGFSSEEADAAIKAHHLSDEAQTAAGGVRELKNAQDEIALSTQDWHKVIDTIDGSIVPWAEHLLETGVSAKSVAIEYGLTASQVRSLEQDIANNNKVLAEATKRAEELAAGTRLSKQEQKDFAISWQNLVSIGGTYLDVLDTVNPAVVEQVKYYASLGATVDDLTKAFPGLTKAQAEAAVEGVKSAQEVRKVWLDVFTAQAKAHGDNIKDFIALETDRYNITIEKLRQTGKATAEMLNAEKALYLTTIDAEIKKREEQIPTSKAFYEREVNEAKAKLDLMLTHSSDFIDQDIRLAEHDYTAKRQLLEHWAQDASDKLDATEKKTADSSAKQGQSLDQLGGHFGRLSGEIDNTGQHIKILDGNWVTDSDIAAASLNKTTLMVRTLSGELVSLAEAQRRQQMGGSVDVNAGNLHQELGQLGFAGFEQDADKLAAQGYSLEQILWIFKNPGQPKPSPQNGVPGFGSPSGTGGGAPPPTPHNVTMAPAYSGPGGSTYRQLDNDNHWQAGEQTTPAIAITLGPGAVQMNYPILNDRTALANVGDMFSDAIVESLTRKGIRVGQR